ncbi:MAG: PIN domain-containing protein [Deltaproteobacteria bacterium]|nr:PIN domain-containing protein [Deltaproteobacteria bacterium]
MKGAARVFLDANVLFFAALGGPLFQRLWLLAEHQRVVLLTSAHCLDEALRNVTRKRPVATDALTQCAAAVLIVAEGDVERQVWARALLPEHDAPVLAAAVDARAHALITGDVKHFGPLMARTDLPLRVRTIRNFFLEGPGR